MRIAVIGGGLGGLSTAGFLVRAGLEDVQVYEQAGALGEIGAGIQVPPNAVRLLHRLGVVEQLDDAGVRLETGWEFRRWRTGEVLYSQRLGTACEERFGAPYYVAHRAGLLDALLGVLPDGIVHVGKRCAAVEETGDEVHVTFEDGETITADVVIGADGIHSVVRGAVTTPSPPTFSGLAGYRCMLPAEAAPPMALEPGFTVWLGPGRHLVHYPVSAGREVNLVAIVPAGEWRTESWIAEGTLEGLLAEHVGWADDVQTLLRLAPKAYLYAFYDREPLARFVRGRIALIGDAAHPMLPFLPRARRRPSRTAGARPVPARAERAHRASRYERAARPRVGVSAEPRAPGVTTCPTARADRDAASGPGSPRHGLAVRARREPRARLRRPHRSTRRSPAGPPRATRRATTSRARRPPRPAGGGASPASSRASGPPAESSVTNGSATTSRMLTELRDGERVVAGHGGDDRVAAQEAQLDAVRDLDRAAHEPGVDRAGRDADEAVVEAELPERDAHAWMARAERAEDLRRQVAAAVRHEADRRGGRGRDRAARVRGARRRRRHAPPAGPAPRSSAPSGVSPTPRGQALEQGDARAGSPGAGSRG